MESCVTVSGHNTIFMATLVLLNAIARAKTSLGSKPITFDKDMNVKGTDTS